uniref:phosphatase PAP2 family protein n=1 Tax=uncultured Draconibacterium sp. TaxID=1573823 RepID=UPI0032173DED
MRGINCVVSIVFLICFLFGGNVLARKNDTLHVYNVNRKVELPLTLGLFGISVWGYNYLGNKEGVSFATAQNLRPENVWWFDRPATKQDASFRGRANNISDIVLNSTVALPALLGFDKNIRKDWFDILLLYGESHAVNSDFYILNSALISRARPFNYNPDVPVEEKVANESRNSFYSGHVSSTAAASFFMAKVYSDYHPELGNKKYWLFAAAAVPASVVGLYRYKAMKHFPTDILVGFTVGAATGFLIPHLHKIKKEGSAWSIVPFAGKISGFQITYTPR